jgi:GNAT superfamily N-acetyltransferase
MAQGRDAAAVDSRGKGLKHAAHNHASPSVTDGYSIRRLDPSSIRAKAAELADVLVDCVAGGASVSFMSGLDRPRAERFWQGIADRAASDCRAVLVAVRDADGTVVGTVQMIPAGTENQPHRADISKMLVMRAHRRHGLGAALMRAAEAVAIDAGKTLLTLDTASDAAERLYASLGWTRVGVIPNYALNPDGSPCDTVIFYKEVGTISRNEGVAQLLSDLCRELGFCVPPNAIERISAFPDLTADQFATEVLRAEGFNPEYEPKWRNKLKQRFTERFGTSRG